LIKFIKEEDAEVDSYEFEFENLSGVRVIGDTAVNHYRIRFEGRNVDGSKFREVIHVSHTWVKEDIQWKLVSGLAYDVVKS
jgi:ketosteroid isomerase-like protein